MRDAWTRHAALSPVQPHRREVPRRQEDQRRADQRALQTSEAPPQEERQQEDLRAAGERLLQVWRAPQKLPQIQQDPPQKLEQVQQVEALAMLRRPPEPSRREPVLHRSPGQTVETARPAERRVAPRRLQCRILM